MSPWLPFGISLCKINKLEAGYCSKPVNLLGNPLYSAAGRRSMCRGEHVDYKHGFAYNFPLSENFYDTSINQKH